MKSHANRRIETEKREVFLMIVMRLIKPPLEKKNVCNFRFTKSVTTADGCGCDYSFPSTKRTLYQMVDSSNCKRGKIQSKE